MGNGKPWIDRDEVYCPECLKDIEMPVGSSTVYFCKVCDRYVSRREVLDEDGLAKRVEQINNSFNLYLNG